MVLRSIEGEMWIAKYGVMHTYFQLILGQSTFNIFGQIYAAILVPFGSLSVPCKKRSFVLTENVHMSTKPIFVL